MKVVQSLFKFLLKLVNIYIKSFRNFGKISWLSSTIATKITGIARCYSKKEGNKTD